MHRDIGSLDGFHRVASRKENTSDRSNGRTHPQIRELNYQNIKHTLTKDGNVLETLNFQHFAPCPYHLNSSASSCKLTDFTGAPIKATFEIDTLRCATTWCREGDIVTDRLKKSDSAVVKALPIRDLWT